MLTKYIVDPNIAVTEFGVSDFVAKKLTYPERVTQYNYRELQTAIINGPDEHPGAVAIIHPDGRKERLSRKGPKFKKMFKKFVLAATKFSYSILN